MELVIFFIIIMIILSSLSKYLQGGGEQGKQDDPHEFQGSDKSSSFDDFFEFLKEGESAQEKGPSGQGSEYGDLGTQEKGKPESYRGKEGRASVYTEYSPEEAYVPSTPSKGQVTAQDSARRRERNVSAGLSSHNTVSKSRGSQERNKAYTSLRKNKSVHEGELQELLMSDKLYLGIAAAEILGPPRSKKPYRRRI